MPFHTIHEFLEEWKEERDSSLKILRALSNESLGQSVTPDGRSLGFLAWHVILAHGEMIRNLGLEGVFPEDDAPEPGTAAALVGWYERTSENLAGVIAAHWTDAMLPGMITMYGMQWTRSMALHSLIVHEIHHRGQMTVLMRQAGIKVPGVYGPAREEWALMNMPAQR